MNKTVADQLTRARTALVLDQPFFGHLALRLKLVEDARHKTLAVDGKHIYYNPDFVASLSPALTKAAMGHEVMHCVFEHISRRGDRNPKKWNCVDEYARITMADGSFRSAGLVQVGDLIRTPFGNTPVLAKKTSSSSDIVELVFVSGNKLTCTGDHKILTQNGYKNAIDLDTTYDSCFVDTSPRCPAHPTQHRVTPERNSSGNGVVCDTDLLAHGKTRLGKKPEDCQAQQPQEFSELDSRGDSLLCGYSGWRGHDHSAENIEEGAYLPTSGRNGEQHLAGSPALAGKHRDVCNHQDQHERESLLATAGVGLQNRRTTYKSAALSDHQTQPLEIAVGAYLAAVATRASRPADSAHASLVRRNQEFECSGLQSVRRLGETRNVVDLTTSHRCFIVEGTVVHNCAGDYVINQCLKDAGFEIGENWLLNPAFAGMSADHIYSLLPEDDGGGNGGPGEPGGSLDEVLDGDRADAATDAVDWQIATIQAAASAKAAGKLPASLHRFVDELTAPKVDWREMLRRFVTEVNKDDYTWSRANRRFLPQGFFLPSLYSENMGEIVVAIDTSGSIDAPTLAAFGSEIKAIVQSTRPSKTTVIYCDACVNHIDVFMPNDELQFNMHGGGGTAFEPVMQYVEENNIKPVCLVYLTDLYGNHNFTPPEYPVMWCSTTDQIASFGQTIPIKI